MFMCRPESYREDVATAEKVPFGEPFTENTHMLNLLKAI